MAFTVIVAVFALNVSPVMTRKFNRVQVIAAAPRVSVLVPVPVISKNPVLNVCPLMSTVPVKAPIVNDREFAVAVTVTVPPPELASKVTSSEAVGTDAPLEPPDIADQ